MTGYIDKRLRRTNETILYRAHLAWMPVLIGGIPLTLLSSGVAGAVMGMTRNARLAALALGAGLLLTLLSRVPGILGNLGTDIVVTDRRLHSKTGILDVDDDHETPLTNIDDTVADPTILGRLFGYGDVFVHTYGSGQGSNDSFTFRRVADPYELVAVINETHDQLISGGAPAPWSRSGSRDAQPGRRDPWDDGGYGGSRGSRGYDEWGSRGGRDWR